MPHRIREALWRALFVVIGLLLAGAAVYCLLVALRAVLDYASAWLGA